ncbi:MAG: dihydrofolate reductase family protein, partial [Paracoccaceae bacterium]
LTVRDMGMVRQPVRVVISRGLNLPEDGKLAESARDWPLWLMHGASATAARREVFAGKGARMFECGESAGSVYLVAALQALGQAGLTRVFAEGGGSLAAALLKADLVDELVLFSGGRVIGGDGLAAVAPLDHAVLEAAPRFCLRDQQTVGGDVVSYWTRA